MRNIKHHLIQAVFTMTLFSIIDRVLGFLFKIYLSRELGAVSMGIYQVAISMFFLLLTVTTSGLPLIVSKMTAKFRTLKDEKSEYGTVGAALIVGLVCAFVTCLAVVLLRTPISKLFASPESMTLLLFLLPGVAFSGIYAAFRGNMWGRQKYTAVSVIEVIEQVFRILLCVLLFLMGFDKLKMTALSMTAACGVTTLCVLFCYLGYRGKLASPKGRIVPLIKQSAPITVVRASGSIVNSLIAIVVPFLLCAQGFTNDRALYLFGASIGMALPLLYIPITVVGSLAYVMIPTLSAAYAEKNKASMCRQIETALTFSIVVAALFVPAFWALGEPIGRFVYDNADSGSFLSTAAWLLVPLSVENIASSMLNSLDLEKQGFINYLIGALVLFGILFAFYKRFTIGVLSFGMGASWTVASILDIRCIRKRTGIKLSCLAPLAKSVALIFPAAFLTKTVFTLCSSMPLLFSIGVSAVAGFVFMLVLGIVFGTIDLSVLFSRRKNPKKRLKSFAQTGQP